MSKYEGTLAQSVDQLRERLEAHEKKIAEMIARRDNDVKKINENFRWTWDNQEAHAKQISALTTHANDVAKAINTSSIAPLAFFAVTAVVISAVVHAAVLDELDNQKEQQAETAERVSTLEERIAALERESLTK